MRDGDNNSAPSIHNSEENLNLEKEELFRRIEEANEDLISASLDDARCDEHFSCEYDESCENCKKIYNYVLKFNCHSCTHTCKKKKRFIRISCKEGLGISDDEEFAYEIITHVCRFKFDKFPMKKTTFLLAISKEEDQNEVNQMKKDLRMIQTYLIRRRYCRESKAEGHKLWLKFEKMSFEEFLKDLGMMQDLDEKLSETEKVEIATKRYVKALRADIKGNGAVYHRRNPSDVYINNYSRKYMPLLRANHDLQYITEPHCCANYVTAYVTKNEAGHSKLVENIEKEMEGKANNEVVDIIGNQIDRKRELSIQEGIYRKNGLPMSKFSIKVKFLCTNHPENRSGLLKANRDELEENESMFYMNSQEYYQKRPEFNSHGFDWDDMSLAEFEAWFERSKNPKHSERSSAIPLQDDSGFLFRRTKPAVLRYYLRYEDPIELARGLLILFFPFRDEFLEIHNKDVLELLHENKDMIEEKRIVFEKNMSLIDLINDIAKSKEEREDEDNEEEEEDDLICHESYGETTNEKDIDDFIKSAKAAALRNINRNIDMSPPEKPSILERMILCNPEQRLILDDIIERFVSNMADEKSFCLYIAGEAGCVHLILKLFA